MKVRIAVTVDVDTDSWASNYGVEGATEIRADVQAYGHNLVTEHFRDLGLLRS